MRTALPVVPVLVTVREGNVIWEYRFIKRGLEATTHQAFSTRLLVLMLTGQSLRPNIAQQHLTQSWPPPLGYARISLRPPLMWILLLSAARAFEAYF